MTTQDAATYLGITETTLRHRVKRGQIPYCKRAGRLSFDRLAIDRDQQAGTRKGPRSQVPQGVTDAQTSDEKT